MGLAFKKKQSMVANVEMAQMFELALRDVKVFILKDLEKNVNKYEQIRNSGRERKIAKTKI